VSLGGDADTIGAVTGQLAGAIYGLSAIPDRWLERLAWRERIKTAALALVEPENREPSNTSTFPSILGR
jgi:ADP-ribosyl-[dinitrogen reductase] hydrolase